MGGPKWGPFASWTAGWCNLLGQIAGVASGMYGVHVLCILQLWCIVSNSRLSPGGYSGAQVVADIVLLTNNYTISSGEFLGLYAAILVLAGIVNTFSETLLCSLCYISVMWHFFGVIIIFVWMTSTAPILQSPAFVLTNFENGSTLHSKYS